MLGSGVLLRRAARRGGGLAHQPLYWGDAVIKKNDRKVKGLKLNRETIARLGSEELTKAQGGFGGGWECTGCDSGCGIFVNLD